jgi:hypothetical protein
MSALAETHALFRREFFLGRFFAGRETDRPAS